MCRVGQGVRLCQGVGDDPLWAGEQGGREARPWFLEKGALGKAKSIKKSCWTRRQ